MAIVSIDELERSSAPSGGSIVSIDDLENEIPKLQENSSSDFIPNTVAGGAGVLAASGLGYLGKKNIIDPIIERSKTKNYLKSVGKQFSLDPKLPVEDVPGALNIKEGNIGKQYKAQTTDIQKVLNDVDNVQIAQKADSLANYIKTNWMTTHKKVMDNYKSYVDRIDTMAENSGVELSNRAYAEDVLDKVINKARESGLSDSDLKVYEDTKKALLGKSTIVDPNTLEPLEVSLKPSDAKSIMSNLKRLDPYGRISSYLDDSYTEFMAKHTPAEVSKLYQEANAGYKPYAEARFALEGTSPSGAGEFNTKKLTSILEDYAKKNKGGDTAKLIEFLDKGNNIVPPIPGVGQQFSELDNLRIQRNTLKQSIKDIEAKTALEQATISGAKEGVYSNKSRLLAATSKLENLNPLKLAGKALGFGKGLIRAVPGGVIENRMQEAAIGEDPVYALDALLKANFGSEKEKAMGRIKQRGEELAWQEQNQT